MLLRQSNINQLDKRIFDVLIIGGGINGAVCAAALSSHGVSVALIEKGDFACSTSQSSSNLIWGGIKYLQNGEFSLVRKLCRSRNQLIKAFPSNVKEIRFLASVKKDFPHRPFTIFLSTILYWCLGSFFTRPPQYFFCKKKLKKAEPHLNIQISQGGFAYSDAYLVESDARFVFNFIRSALDNGAVASNYMASLGSSQKGKKKLWHTQAKNQESGRTLSIRSKIIINACGPDVDSLNNVNKQVSAHKHLLSKGVHIIVPKVTTSLNHILFFIADDNRPFFVIPMGKRSCIGTTDTRVESLPTQVSRQDRLFLLDNANKHLDLKRPLRAKDIIAERCGVRPLVTTLGQQQNSQKNSNEKDWISLSRKHIIETDRKKSYISIYGGKFTDCIRIGNEIIAELEKFHIKMNKNQVKWYGETDSQAKTDFFHQAHAINLEASISEWLWRRYDCHALSILEDIRQKPELSKPLIEKNDYIYGELHYAARREMVVHLEDLLRRRSHLALCQSPRSLAKANSLKTACRILFAQQGQKKYDQYFKRAMKRSAI